MYILKFSYFLVDSKLANTASVARWRKNKASLYFVWQQSENTALSLVVLFYCVWLFLSGATLKCEPAFIIFPPFLSCLLFQESLVVLLQGYFWCLLVNPFHCIGWNMRETVLRFLGWSKRWDNTLLSGNLFVSIAHVVRQVCLLRPYVNRIQRLCSPKYSKSMLQFICLPIFSLRNVRGLELWSLGVPSNLSYSVISFEFPCYLLILS